MTDDDLIRRMLDALPDVPRFLEVRATLLSGLCKIFESANGVAIRNDAPGGGLIALVGRPEPVTIRAALADGPHHELLCAPEDEAHLAEHFPAWERERAVLHTLADANRLAAPDGRVRVLQANDSLAHLPDELREELEAVREQREVLAAFEADRPVSFAYAFWRTERYFDISIDTRLEFRRRGFARVTVSELIRRERALGREPVWGAVASNRASLQLARTLGFTEVDSVVIAARD